MSERRITVTLSGRACNAITALGLGAVISLSQIKIIKTHGRFSLFSANGTILIPVTLKIP